MGLSRTSGMRRTEPARGESDSQRCVARRLERNSQQKFPLVLITLEQPITRQEVLGSPACIPNLWRNVEKQGMNVEPEADHHCRGRVVVELGRIQSGCRGGDASGNHDSRDGLLKTGQSIQSQSAIDVRPHAPSSVSRTSRAGETPRRLRWYWYWSPRRLPYRQKSNVGADRVRPLRFLSRMAAALQCRS